MTGRAGYRFVPFGDKIVEPPVLLKDLKLDTPHEEGSISGTLEVTWAAETPVCIGAEGGDRAVEPFEIAGRGCLPGASLRGMLRNVMEIVGFCHLGSINDHRHFGFRDFTDAANYRSRVQANDIKAGWLSHEDDEWILTEAAQNGAFYPVKFESILDRVGNPVDAKDWRIMPIHCKRLLLAKSSPNLMQGVAFTQDGVYWGNVQRGQFALAGRQPNGHLVVGGAATDSNANRANEVFVGSPSQYPHHRHVLHKNFIELFNRINANPGRKNPEPTGAWRYWLGQKAWKSGLMAPGQDDPEPINQCGLPGIPVFFCGDPRTASDISDYDPKTSSFVMGISRVIKIPYSEGVGDVAAKLYSLDGPYRVPRLGERFDLARAIFGWLDEAGDNDEEVGALAGRVAFSPAFSPLKPQRTTQETFVFGSPRESFCPFYLDGDYHGNGGKPIGRKRYPARSTPNGPNIPNENTATQSRVSFHAPGTTYAGRIRVHNLHPVEFAAFVWCLTFGAVDGPWRHAIGRAKGYGYGCLHLERLAWARPPKIEGSVETDDWDALAETFETWMSERLGHKFTETETIRRLRAYANPKMGDRHRKRLSYPSVEDFKNLQVPVDAGEDWQPL